MAVLSSKRKKAEFELDLDLVLVFNLGQDLDTLETYRGQVQQVGRLRSGVSTVHFDCLVEAS